MRKKSSNWRTTRPGATWRAAGDDHYRVPARPLVGSALALALAVVVVVLALAGSVVWWGGASAGARVLLVALDLGALSFGLVVCAHVLTDMQETRDRHTFNVDRRRLVLARLETLLSIDIDGDGLIGDLPRPVPVRAGDRRGLVRLDGDGDGDGSALARLLTVVDAIDQAGTPARRQVLPLVDYDRPAYDWSCSILQSLGLLVGRSERSAGVLVGDAEVVKRAIVAAWRGAMSTSGNGGDGLGSQDDQPTDQGGYGV